MRSKATSRSAVRSSRRARRPSLSNDEFLKKALEVFYDKGFDGASIDAITASAGIAKRTIYARFGDKETLFRKAIEHAIDDWNLPIDKLRAAETDTLEDSLTAIGLLLIENILTPAGLRLLRLTNAESGRMPELGAHNVRYGQDPVIAYIADLFRRKLPEHRSFQEIDEAAEAFLLLVVGGPANAAAWGVSRDWDAIEKRARLSITIFYNGLISVAGRPDGTGIEEARAELKRVSGMLEDAARRLHFVDEAVTRSL